MLEEHIKNFYRAKITTLKESGIHVFRSAQVTLRKIDDNLEYREISIGKLHHPDSKKIKTGANPTSLKKQALQAGDVLISARSKLGKVGLIRERDLSKRIPTVAMNGIIIIRSGSEELGYFIKSYLESEEVQDYVNNDPRTVKNGKRVITTDIILELPFPDIIQKDFSTFKEFKEVLDSIRSKSFMLQRIIANLGNLQLAQASLQDITDINSYNPDDWNEIKEAQERVEELTDLLAKKIGGPAIFIKSM